ncbi:protein phosphatase regulator, variant 2 [Entomophthora muscae]|uniref:Protein phosphatase regulator, variant 2 n=1 Tax=Entomophthora muscae TaxID=34485 RepID=A0ACC2TL31_9FUNG|nr:protein phosphatase regulator, variant 2 [Entomophthora muscae]
MSGWPLKLITIIWRIIKVNPARLNGAKEYGHLQAKLAPSPLAQGESVHLAKYPSSLKLLKKKVKICLPEAKKSGTAVRYPGLPDNVGSMLDGLFSRVNKPRPADEEDEEENEEEPKPKSKFSGSGMRLGETAVSEASETAPGSFSNQTIPSSSRNQVVVRNLTLWSNGLTLEDGPLMSYDSPEGRQFMEAVSRGMAPLDLLGAEQGQKVDVHVHRKLEEEYKAPPAALRPFSGTGNRLGR